jgi:predicted aspartyl protease
MARRREAGLCFNCPKKFSRDHLKQCSMRSIYLLEMGNEWSPEGADVPEDMEVSLHAITRVSTGNTMQLAVRVTHHTVAALVDSGSTHCFVAPAMAQRLGGCHNRVTA